MVLHPRDASVRVISPADPLAFTAILPRQATNNSTRSPGTMAVGYRTDRAPGHSSFRVLRLLIRVLDSKLFPPLEPFCDFLLVPEGARRVESPSAKGIGQILLWQI